MPSQSTTDTATSTATASFAPIRKAIGKFDRAALIALVGELHALNPQNRDFLAARFVSASDGLDKCKKIILRALCPENGCISFRDARAAIGNYRKSTGDTGGLAELYVYAAECATRFTAEYGDIGEPFYNSLERMYAAAAKTTATLDPQTAAPLKERLRAMMDKTRGFGWGLHDVMCQEYETAFRE